MGTAFSGPQTSGTLEGRLGQLSTEWQDGNKLENARRRTLQLLGDDIETKLPQGCRRFFLCARSFNLEEYRKEANQLHHTGVVIFLARMDGLQYPTLVAIDFSRRLPSFVFRYANELNLCVYVIILFFDEKASDGMLRSVLDATLEQWDNIRNSRCPDVDWDAVADRYAKATFEQLPPPNDEESDTCFEPCDARDVQVNE